MSRADQFLSKATEIVKKIFGNKSKILARIYIRIGDLNKNQKNYSQALTYYHLCVFIYEGSVNTNNRFYINSLIHLGDVYLKLAEYDNAGKYLYKALKSQRLRSGKFSNRYKRLLDYIISVYVTFIEEKESYFKRWRRTLPYPDFSVIDNELSKLYIEICEISKRKNGLLHPEYHKNLEKLMSVSSFQIVEPYFREVMELFHNNGDFERAKLFEENLKNIRYRHDSTFIYDDHSKFSSDGSRVAGIPRHEHDPILISGLANNIDDDELKSQITCSLFSVPEAYPGDDIFIQIFTHYPERAEEAFSLALEFDKDASRRQSRTFDIGARNEADLSFELEINDITIEDPIQYLKWKGASDSVQFIVTIPKGYSKHDLIGKVRVASDNVPIGHLCFKIIITNPAGLKKSLDQSNFSPMKNYRHAFISYASKDRAEVLKRVQMLDLLKIQYFQDILNLNPGDQWEKELFKQIALADVFFLFWSSAARNSEWVLKEVEYAEFLKLNDEDNPPEIYPVLLEGPPMVEPPDSLKHLHFNDKIVYFI